MISRYFIDRPIFAWVIAVVVMLAGILALRSLPVAQFPPIAAPVSDRISMQRGPFFSRHTGTATRLRAGDIRGMRMISRSWMVSCANCSPAHAGTPCAPTNIGAAIASMAGASNVERNGGKERARVTIGGPLMR